MIRSSGLLLNRDLSSRIGLLEIRLVFLYLSLLNLDSLDGRSLERFLDAALCKFRGIFDVKSLKFLILIE